jgi:hypothetical protein
MCDIPLEVSSKSGGPPDLRGRSLRRCPTSSSVHRISS